MKVLGFVAIIDGKAESNVFGDVFMWTKHEDAQKVVDDAVYAYAKTGEVRKVVRGQASRKRRS